MAPEVMCKNNHGIAADYFAVGVIAYECMQSRRPYQGKTRREIRDAILAKQVQIKKSEVPDSWSFEAADFINKVSFTHIISLSHICSVWQEKLQADLALTETTR